MLTLGIDLGTQSCKAVVLHEPSGAVVGRGSASLALSSPRPGWAEQDPADWLAAVAASTSQALAAAAAAGHGAPVAAVCVAGQQHGLVLLDADGCVLRPALLWCDTRASAEAGQLSALAGHVVPPSFTAPKMLWLKVHEPDAWAAAARVLLPASYVGFALTGRAFIDASDASGLGVFDSARRVYDARLCAAVDPRLLGGDGGDGVRGGGGGGLLPRLCGPDETAGWVTPAAAARFGLPPGCPVGAGGGDNAFCALGVGAAPGELLLSLGTSGTLFRAAAPPPPQPYPDPSGAVAPFCDAAGAWLPLSCTLNCALPAAEVRAAFGLTPEEAEAAALAAAPGGDGSADPLFLPYLTGERTPNWPHASGALLGLRPGDLSSPGVLYRAAVEGAVLSLRLAHGRMLAAGLPPATSLLVVGGAGGSPLWLRAVADAFGLPARAAGEPGAAAARGAAVAAAALATGVPVVSLARARAPPPAGAPVQPDAGGGVERMRRLGERFERAGVALFG